MKKNLHLSVSLPIYPCKDSDGDIGIFLLVYKKPDDLWGKFALGFNWGKYMVEYSQKKGWEFCDYWATGCGG